MLREGRGRQPQPSPQEGSQLAAQHTHLRRDREQAWGAAGCQTLRRGMCGAGLSHTPNLHWTLKRTPTGRDSPWEPAQVTNPRSWGCGTSPEVQLPGVPGSRAATAQAGGGTCPSSTLCPLGRTGDVPAKGRQGLYSANSRPDAIRNGTHTDTQK